MALSKLCESYWSPIYSYLRRRGYSRDDAQDLTQEFLTRFVEHNRVARADPVKGRFRSFLLASLKNFLCDEWDKARAKKRGGGMQVVSLQFDTAEMQYAREPADMVTPEGLYELNWAMTILDNALNSLREQYAAEDKASLFAALHPCLTDDPAAKPYAVLAEHLGMTESGVKSAVHRLRRRYRETLRAQIAHTVASKEDIDDELRYLTAVLGR